MKTEREIRELLERVPGLRPLLVRLARRVLEGKALPTRFSVRGIDYLGQRELEGLLGAPTVRRGEGVVTGQLPTEWREPAAWQNILAALDLRRTEEVSAEDFLTRLVWSVPEVKSLVDCLRQTPEVMRFLKRPVHRDAWRKVLLGLWDMHRQGVAEITTLSQLGSQWLNDSKSLRSGPLRRQLVLLLTILSGRDVDERTLLATYGIFDNPYTSGVTFFAPIAFVTMDGARFDFPAQLFAAGLATTLPSETVERIAKVAWKGAPLRLITCENAAPFAQYVASRRPVLYTEGYPNFAVQRLLGLLGGIGVEAEHAGDADFDGFRIAAMIGRALPVRRVLAAEIVRNPAGVPGIPLTDEQQSRVEYFLTRFPQMPYAAEIACLLERGCWYEQETFVSDVSLLRPCIDLVK